MRHIFYTYFLHKKYEIHPKFGKCAYFYPPCPLLPKPHIQKQNVP
jgi:hypothetical protein